jgi:hypothetical protein
MGAGMTSRRYHRVSGLPLGIEGCRPASSLRGLLFDIARLVRWISGH